MGKHINHQDRAALVDRIKHWAKDLGFQQLGISNTDLTPYKHRLRQWLDRGMHGEMHYMARNSEKRIEPETLFPTVRSIISLRMNYYSADGQAALPILRDPLKGYIARYALGRDYHLLIRQRLRQLSEKISAEIGPWGYRSFCDSAPVLEKPLAEKAGLGWIGKHTNLLNRTAGSWFFLAEIYSDLALPPQQQAVTNSCGSCQNCIQSCPTGAIVAPYVLDARRCIAYLTIELKGAIPLALRPLIGNRIFGCDDCQLFCPWNGFSSPSQEADFRPRNKLDQADLVTLFNWSEQEFCRRSNGSPIARIGYLRWLRNIAVALGNAPSQPAVIAALQARVKHPSALLREHVHWALSRHGLSAP